MRLLLAGATGYLGSRVASALVSRKHDIVALARSGDTEKHLRAAGYRVYPGNLASPDLPLAAFGEVDGMINVAFDHGIDFADAVEQERRSMQTIIEALAGSNKVLVMATATGILGETGPEPVDEDFEGQEDFPARIRMAVEDDLKQAASKGVRTIIVRPAILAHGHGASRIVPTLIRSALQRGEAGHPGDGSNRIATVHVDDLAELFVLAAESGRGGSVYNGSGGDISTAELAKAIAKNRGARVVSYTREQAVQAWGPFMAMLLGINNRASGERARHELGWRPYERAITLTEDVSVGSYAPQFIA